jgi:hypothetical protein
MKQEVLCLIIEEKMKRTGNWNTSTEDRQRMKIPGDITLTS